LCRPPSHTRPSTTGQEDGSTRRPRAAQAASRRPSRPPSPFSPRLRQSTGLAPPPRMQAQARGRREQGQRARKKVWATACARPSLGWVSILCSAQDDRVLGNGASRNAYPHVARDTLLPRYHHTRARQGAGISTFYYPDRSLYLKRPLFTCGSSRSSRPTSSSGPSSARAWWQPRACRCPCLLSWFSVRAPARFAFPACVGRVSVACG
jgi:hypothetical protein